MRILRAEHLGMCFGVRDAIALATEQAAIRPLTILGDLVHNEIVLADLRARGVSIESNADQVKTHDVMITAHGASERALNRTRALGLRVVEATCPLVRLAHQSVARLVRKGYHPIIIGQRHHVEVRGLTEDLAAFDVVLSEDDVDALPERSRLGIAAQTTQPIDRVRHLVWRICKRFPHADVRFVDTVCRPTKQRQHAAVELAQQCDVVIVIGGAHSNNTRELVETCRKHCACVHHVQTASDLKHEWFANSDTVGITAGTSTPDSVIDDVERALAKMQESSGTTLIHSEKEKS